MIQIRISFGIVVRKISLVTAISYPLNSRRCSIGSVRALRRAFFANLRGGSSVSAAYNTFNGVRTMDNFQETCVTEKETAEEPASDPSSGPAARRENPERSLELALAAARTAAENGGTNIVVLDMTRHTAVFDYFVIATGTSRRQLHAISEEIDRKLEDDLNDKRMNIDGYDESKWIVLDYSTVVIHLFDEDTRTFYSLEDLWADASKVDLTDALKDVRV